MVYESKRFCVYLATACSSGSESVSNKDLPLKVGQEDTELIKENPLLICVSIVHEIDTKNKAKKEAKLQ